MAVPRSTLVLASLTFLALTAGFSLNAWRAADGTFFASWPIELATQIQAISASRTEIGRAGPANCTENRIENAIAAPGAMCVIDWNSTCGRPIEFSRR